MVMKRPLWPRSRCRGLTELSGAQQTSRVFFARYKGDAEALHQRTFSTPAIVKRPNFDELSPWRTQNDVQHAPLPSRSASVEYLLHAVQSQNPANLIRTLADVGVLLKNEDHEDHISVRQAIEELPAATVSEIFRCFDPLTATDQDVAHGHHIGHSFTLYSPSADIVDDRGLRKVRMQIYHSLWHIFQIRREMDPGLTILDYEVMMRCAGVAFERNEVKRIFGLSAEDQLQDDRTVRTWKTFLEGRFLTDPAYYQFDKSRVVFLPRNLPSSKLSPAAFTRLEKLRMALNATSVQPWNVDEWSGMDVRRLLRHKTGRKSSINDFYKAIFHGHAMDEEALCTAMVAFSRSGSSREIRYSILRAFYGLEVKVPADPTQITVSGGTTFADDDPRKPTSKLLYAITEAFGSCSDIIPALRIMDYVSKTWNVPIPATAWSNLLQWTYINSCKPYRTMHRLARSRLASYMGPQAVRDVFELMTSEPHNVTPTVDDYNVIIKVFTDARSLTTAANLVRTKLVPQYDRAVKDHEEALLDEVLINNTGSSRPDAAGSRRREAAAVKKDYLHRLISTWCQQYLTRIGASSKTSRHQVTALPDLIRELGDFFPTVIQYQIPSGHVTIDRRGDSDVIARYDWVGTTRWTRPTKRGRHTLPGDPVDESGFQPDWPVEHQVLVKQKQARARLRAKLDGDKLSEEGDSEDGEAYWKRIRRELLL